MSDLTHVDQQNRPTMVDVGSKTITERQAVAECLVELPPQVLAVFEDGEFHSKKGPVIATAVIAGTMAAKRTSELIPFCHALALNSCKIETNLDANVLRIRCAVKVTARTGVEMEALVGAQIAALTIYDMCKALSHEIVIRQCQLVEKKGGKNDFSRR
jgi:cyclic pyranopterin monophosphate synthase